MKKIISFALVAVIISAMFAVTTPAAFLSEGNFDVLITEVCVAPMSDFKNGFGQLVEIYNNTDGEIDLYNYEMMITSGRSVKKIFKESEQFGGLIKITNKQNEAKLASGELAVIWIVYNDASKQYTENTMRDEMKKLDAEIPTQTQVFRVDTTDPEYFYGKAEENHLETSTRYLFINKRGCFDLNKEKELANYADGDNTMRGAFVRVYGVEDGTSQHFGTPVNSGDKGGQLNWQKDGTTAKSYTAPNFGGLEDSDNIKQSEMFIGAKENVVETESESVTESGSVTESERVTESESITETEKAETKAPDTQKVTDKPAEEKGGCKSTVGISTGVIAALCGAALVLAKKNKKEDN